MSQLSYIKLPKFNVEYATNLLRLIFIYLYKKRSRVFLYNCKILHIKKSYFYLNKYVNYMITGYILRVHTCDSKTNVSRLNTKLTPIFGP